MRGHQSVLLSQALEALKPAPGKVIVDGTLGRAGHAEKILEAILPGGLLIGIDKDPQAVHEAGEILARFGNSVRLVRTDFRNMKAALAELKVPAVDGVLLDLGVSSPQLETARRGFSFQNDGPLDMRMDPDSGMTAADIVNQFPAERICAILSDFGQERLARRISERIVEARRRAPVRTTKDLENIIFHAVPRSYRYGRIHPATRSFQALRIAVNRELEALEFFLRDCAFFLKPGGRLVIITFHSLEDRMVKNGFKSLEKESMGNVVTKKPLVPKEDEISLNPRSRSAKLRIFERSFSGPENCMRNLERRKECAS